MNEFITSNCEKSSNCEMKDHNYLYFLFCGKNKLSCMLTHQLKIHNTCFLQRNQLLIQALNKSGLSQSMIWMTMMWYVTMGFGICQSCAFCVSPTTLFYSFTLQDLVDSDALLDADDLKKPDPSSLKASCGDDSKKKKKACKNW